MRLPPYSEYKPSGIEWLGEVPEHWESEATQVDYKRNYQRHVGRQNRTASTT